LDQEKQTQTPMILLFQGWN